MAIKLSQSNGMFIKEAGKKILLQITKANYDQEFGKVELEFKNERGEIINENYNLMANDGSINEPALKAFSYFTRVAMGDWGVQEVEEEELIGKWLRADIKMTKGSKPDKEGNAIYFANIEKIYMISDEDIDYIADNSQEQSKAASKEKAAAKSKPRSFKSDDLPFAGSTQADDDEEWD